MKKLWVPIAAVFGLVAIILFIQLKFEAAFVVAALGAVAWFLNYRAQIKDQLADELDYEPVDEGFKSDDE
jgi:hypothetical protein